MRYSTFQPKVNQYGQCTYFGFNRTVGFACIIQYSSKRARPHLHHMLLSLVPTDFCFICVAAGHGSAQHSACVKISCYLRRNIDHSYHVFPQSIGCSFQGKYFNHHYGPVCLCSCFRLADCRLCYVCEFWMFDRGITINGYFALNVQKIFTHFLVNEEW